MPSQFKVLLLNGPNLNMLGKREPHIYGKHTLQECIRELQQDAEQFKVQLTHLQSNSESVLIDKIQQSFQLIDFIIINPAAFTHTSIALRDALSCVNIPFIEVHLTNIHQREPFRHQSYFSDIAQGVICGLGISGYRYALASACHYLQTQINQTKSTNQQN